MEKEEFLKKYGMSIIETPNNYDVKMVYEIVEFFGLISSPSSNYDKVYVSNEHGRVNVGQVFHVEQIIYDTVEVLKTESEKAFFNTIGGVCMERTIHINSLLNKIKEWHIQKKTNEEKQPLFEVGVEVRSNLYITDKEGNKHTLRKAGELNLWRVEGSEDLYEMEGNKIKNIYRQVKQ